MAWTFDNSIARDMAGFHVPCQPEAPPAPELVVWNAALAQELGIPSPGDSADDAPHSDLFAGAALPPGSEPVALAYAGHQFGQFSPRLGDGRAILLGEILTPDGKRLDLQLKGSGRTPFSRGGDGKCAIGPALREYLASEAMAALGVATTRSLAVCTTGEAIIRQKPVPVPGAVVTRLASSHIRVGTFEYFAAHGDDAQVRQLADHAIARHYPHAAGADNPCLALLEAVIEAQARLVASWMNLGFVHGVMNTDNVAISGETLDYGPCAFIDAYSPAACFSSIDRQGRYAYANQPPICHWNMTRLAIALVGPIAALEPSQDAAIERINMALDRFAGLHEAAWLDGMRAKLGLFTAEEGDRDLAIGLLGAMDAASADFTGLFRRLSRVPVEGSGAVTGMFEEPAGIDTWIEAWQSRAAREAVSADERTRRMEAVNPVYIPRNHKVEEALAAAELGDLAPFRALLEVVTHPFEERADWSAYAVPAPSGTAPYVTFCGT